MQTVRQQQGRSLFARPHYDAIAQVLDSLPLEADLLTVAFALADFFERDNPRFIPGMFLDWCVRSK